MLEFRDNLVAEVGIYRASRLINSMLSCLAAPYYRPEELTKCNDGSLPVCSINDDSYAHAFGLLQASYIMCGYGHKGASNVASSPAFYFEEVLHKSARLKCVGDRLPHDFDFDKFLEHVFCKFKQFGMTKNKKVDYSFYINGMIDIGYFQIAMDSAEELYHLKEILEMLENLDMVSKETDGRSYTFTPKTISTYFH